MLVYGGGGAAGGNLADLWAFHLVDHKWRLVAAYPAGASDPEAPPPCEDPAMWVSRDGNLVFVLGGDEDAEGPGAKLPRFHCYSFKRLRWRRLLSDPGALGKLRARGEVSYGTVGGRHLLWGGRTPPEHFHKDAYELCVRPKPSGASDIFWRPLNCSGRVPPARALARVAVVPGPRGAAYFVGGYAADEGDRVDFADVYEIGVAALAP
eukprot:tig00000215_g18563.t1